MGDDKMQWRMHTCIVAMFKITFLSAGRIPTIVRVVFLLRYSALFAIHCYLFLLFISKVPIGPVVKSNNVGRDSRNLSL